MSTKTAEQSVIDSVLAISGAEQIVNESIARIQADLDFIPQLRKALPSDEASINLMELELRRELHAEVQFALDIM